MIQAVRLNQRDRVESRKDGLGALGATEALQQFLRRIVAW